MATTQKNFKENLKKHSTLLLRNKSHESNIVVCQCCTYSDQETATTSEETQPSLKVNKSEGTGLFSFCSLTLDPFPSPRQKPFKISFHFSSGSLLPFLLTPEWRSSSPNPKAPGKSLKLLQTRRVSPQPSLCKARCSSKSFLIEVLYSLLFYLETIKIILRIPKKQLIRSGKYSPAKEENKKFS